MRSTIVLLAGALALAGLPAARGGDDPGGPKVSVMLENLDGSAKLTLDGSASHLPDGTLLHISLVVRDQFPPVEAGFFRVAVVGGKYNGEHTWDQKTFGPLAYRTEVRLLMEVQTPAVKRFLARELGYPAEHIETVSVCDTDMGTAEERAAYQLQTLTTLRDFQQRVTALHESLVTVARNPATDPGFQAFEPEFVSKLKDVLSELETLHDTRVVWFDEGIFAGLNQAIRQLSRAYRKHKGADPTVPQELANTSHDLRRMIDDMESRLPIQPNERGRRPVLPEGVVDANAPATPGAPPPLPPVPGPGEQGGNKPNKPNRGGSR